MSATRRKIDLELDMEETGPAPLARREADRKAPHRFFRFDPTVSSGTMIQSIGLLVIAVGAYGTYQSDRTQTKADIKQIEVSVERDRNDAKVVAGQLTADVKEMKTDIKEFSAKLIKIEAQTSITQQRISK